MAFSHYFLGQAEDFTAPIYKYIYMCVCVCVSVSVLSMCMCGGVV